MPEKYDRKKINMPTCHFFLYILRHMRENNKKLLQQNYICIKKGRTYNNRLV